MKTTDQQLERLFAAAKPAHEHRLAQPATIPFGFATRVGQAAFDNSNGAAMAWARLSRWGLGFACGVMVLTLLMNRTALSNDWSPALTVAQEVSELVSLP